MTLAALLEEFDRAASAGGPARGTPPPTDADVEAARLEGYERGYGSGWEDANAAGSREQARIGADFARNLQELGFTYHEARAHVLRGVEPVLGELLGTLFPAVMIEALGHSLLEELTGLAQDHADAPALIVICPADAEALRPLLSDNTAIPLKIVEDPSLGEGQAYMKLGQSERHVDLSGALARVQTALGALAKTNERKLKHG